MLRVGHRCLSLRGRGRVGGGGCLGRVAVAVDDLLVIRLRGSGEGLRVSRSKQVVGGGELDDGRVLARDDGT